MFDSAEATTLELQSKGPEQMYFLPRLHLSSRGAPQVPRLAAECGCYSVPAINLLGRR